MLETGIRVTGGVLSIKPAMKQNGFTLIEILVAATIIAILSSVGITGYQAITRNSRDTVRKSDLENIRSALEVYKSENGFYPTPTVSCVAALSSDYLNPYPQDPKSATYKYCYNWVSTRQYQMCAHLENIGPTDYPTQCGGANLCGGSCNYTVANP